MIDLQKFCAKDYDPREYLRKPWPHKGHVYATNGHLILRIPSPGDAEAILAQPVADKAVSLFDQATNTGHAPLPAYEQGQECHACGGEGRYKQSKCDSCDGTGEFTRGGSDYECKDCEASGWIADIEGEMRDCDVCDGHGRRSHYAPFAEPRVGYDARYLDMIKDLHGLLFSAGESADVGMKPKAAHFTFDGGEGLLMPRKAD